MERAGARWAVVLDDAENLHGWLSAERADRRGHGRLRRHAGWRRGCRSARRSRRRSPRCCSTRPGWVAVLDGDRFLGVLTPESLHAALRRSVEGAVPEVAGAAR